MHEIQRPGGRGASCSEGPCRANTAARTSRAAAARGALARGAFVALASLGLLWAFEPEARAQAGGAGAAGAGGAPGAAGGEKAGGGQAGGEKSGAGGGAAAAEAQAPPGAERKIVLFVEGPQAAELKAEIEKSLPPGVTVLPEGRFVEALKKHGLLPLAKYIKGPNERRGASPKLQVAAYEVGAQAAIVAVAAEPRGGKYDVPILIVPSDVPDPLTSRNAVVSARGGAQLRGEAIAGIISVAVSGITPLPAAPPPPEPKAEAPKVDEKKPEPPKADEKPPEPAPAAAAAAANNFVRGRFLFEIGAGTQGRSFFYLVPQGFEPADNIKSYKRVITPHAFLRAEVYPFAGPGDSFLNNVGLTAGGGGTVGLKASSGDRDDLAATFFHFRVGPKVRIPVGAGERPLLITGEITYAHLDYTITDPTGVAPSHVYQSVRPGVGVRLPLGPVALLFEGGLHYVVNAGELGRRFPDATVLGFDTRLGLAVPFGSLFEGRFNLNYDRYRGNLNAEIDSSTGYVAAGAIDQFFGAHLGAAVAF